MKLILTALRQEARVIIDSLNLKQDTSSPKIPVYRGEGIALAISGMGKLKAAIATTHLFHFVGKPNNAQLINVGMCGSVVDQLALGEAVIANKIWDNATGKQYFPDMLLNHGLKESSLGTFDQPVTSMNRPMLTCDIVDMEASGIFQAANVYLGPHQVLFIKVVTDYLQFSSDDYSAMQKYYEQSSADWLHLLTQESQFPIIVSILSDDQETLLKSVAESMRLTATQTHQLRDAAKRFLVRGGEELALLKYGMSGTPRHKKVRNQMFDTLIQSLDQ